MEAGPPISSSHFDDIIYFSFLPSLSLSLSLQLQIMAVERCFVPKGKRDTRPNGGLGIDSRLLDCVCCCYPFGHDELRNTSHLLSLSSRSTSALALPQQECRRLFLKGKKRKSSSSFSSARTFLLFISSSSSSHAVHRFLHLLMIGIDVLTRGGCIMFFSLRGGSSLDRIVVDGAVAIHDAISLDCCLDWEWREEREKVSDGRDWQAIDIDSAR